MSLKTFHIFFIALSSATAFGFAWWIVRDPSASAGALVAGGCSALAGAALIVYGIRFLRKLRNVSYL